MQIPRFGSLYKFSVKGAGPNSFEHFDALMNNLKQRGHEHKGETPDTDAFRSMGEVICSVDNLLNMARMGSDAAYVLCKDSDDVLVGAWIGQFLVTNPLLEVSQDPKVRVPDTATISDGWPNKDPHRLKEYLRRDLEIVKLQNKQVNPFAQPAKSLN